MKKVFYEKVGRRYIPVSEYDNSLLDSFPKGDHLVSVYPGGSSRRFNIKPNYAAMIAAGRVAEDAISKAIQQATELRPHNHKMTEEEHQRWIAFIKTMPEDMRFMMTHGSVREAAEAGVKAMMAEADKLMTHEAVKKAWDHFQLMCELTKEKEIENG